MLHIEKGAAQEAAVRFAEPETDPQTGFPIGRDHTDKSRNPHPEQGAGASGSKCSSNTGNISCSNGSSQGRAYRLELADGFRGIFIWRPFRLSRCFFYPRMMLPAVASHQKENPPELKKNGILP